MADALRFQFVLVAVFIFVAAGRAAGMGMESFGPAGEHLSRSPHWPRGVEDVLRDPARVYWYWVNGSEQAYYDGDVAAVNRLLELYSQIEMAEHPVVLQAGRGTATSFNRERSLPYVVAFRVPGGISLHAMRRRGDAEAELRPSLTLCLDAEQAERIGELSFPANVTLEVGPAAGSADEALQQKIAEFVAAHPQRKRELNADELLAALKAADAKYFEGFTARGTSVEAGTSGSGKLVAWTVTIGNQRMVVDQRDVEDADHPPREGRCENTIFAGPAQMGEIQGSRLWIDGKLSEAKPYASLEPVGDTYDLLIGRVLWPLGRGFSHRIRRITKITPERDGVLRVMADSESTSLATSWELWIDPRADYLVRAAKAYRGATVEHAVESAGTSAGGGRSVPHTARWIEGANGAAVSIAVTSVSAAVDEELIESTEERLNRLPKIGE